MKFFIDTANIDEIREAYAMGVVDGVTTNPSLIAKEGREFREIIDDIVKVVDGPISVEVVSTDHDGMVREAKEFAKISDNIVIKVPMIPEGVKVTKTLFEEGIKTNVTLVFSPLQGLIAAKAGATYVSPFVGRLDDIHHEGMELIEQLVTIYANYAFDTEVLVASVRSPMHVLDAALMGADVATIPLGVIKKMMGHPLTDKGLQAFLDDWKKCAVK
ncbi:MAG: fructose-6-phosphate aldolase [Desulfatibacillaceae bacterium]